MSAKLAVLVIHGMGSQGPDFAEPMIAELGKRVADLGNDPSDIAWKSVYWADITEEKELRYLGRATQEADLDYVRLRKFMLSAFGDASAYRHVESGKGTTYDEVHARIREAVAELAGADTDPQTTPMVVLAHSLGAHMMSNYIWDMQKSGVTGLSPFEAMDLLAGLVTFGCNIPLFTFAYSKVVPIEFPPANLPDHLKTKARWFNFYDPDDVLGYPLRPINAAYKQVVTEDIPINVGGLSASWNPMSHTAYWTDDDFTRPVAEFLGTFL